MRTLLFSFFVVQSFLLAAQTVQEVCSVPNPQDVKADRMGNLWVNYHTGTTPDTFFLAKRTPAGLFVNVITSLAELGNFDVNDSILWIGCRERDRVYKYNHYGQLLDSVNVASPAGIILQADGVWYLSQDHLGRVLRYTPDNTQFILASGLPLNENIGLAKDETGMLYVSNRVDANIIRINPHTGEKTLLTTLPTASSYSIGYLAYHSGKLFVPSYYHCIYEVDTNGISYQPYAGTEGVSGDQIGELGFALFNDPAGTAFSVTGDTLFVADRGNNKVKAITGTGSLDVISPDQLQVGVYPNPAAERITVRSGQPINEIMLTDASGNVIIELQCTQTSEELSLRWLPAGSYMLLIQLNDGTQLHRKIIKAGDLL